MAAKIISRTILVYLLLTALSCSHEKTNVTADQSKVLKFNTEGTFKIVQFTDFHYKSTSKRKQENIDIMNHVIEVEKPDFIVLTGDIVIDPVEQGWQEVTKPLIDAKIPWSITFGNHDGETEITKDAIFSWLKEMPYFIGEKGDVSGVINCALPVYSNDGSTIGSVLYLFDSQDYCPTRKYSKYDFIKFDQIAWYREISKKFTAENGNKEIPSLAFFHIPLQEFILVSEETKEKTRFTGQQFEPVKPSEVNSGLFASFIEMEDVFGVFAGHDHENSYIGQVGEICLSYGQVSGVEAVDTNITRGARIIKIHENKFALESWVRTPDVDEMQYHFEYPEYLNDKISSPLNAINVENPVKGLKFKYYEGDILSCRDIKNHEVKEEGIVENVSIEGAEVNDHFAFEFDGFINIPENGLYIFYTNSDDGSVLYIGDQLVVDNDGSHSKKNASGSIALEKGYHRFKLQYFENYAGNFLDIGYSTISTRGSVGARDIFYHKLN